MGSLTPLETRLRVQRIARRADERIDDEFGRSYRTMFGNRSAGRADTAARASDRSIVLVFDVSASGVFGDGDHRRREWMAQLGATVCFAALRNQDPVGLVLFAEEIELYHPPRAGHGQVLRIIRELLTFEAQGRTADPATAITYAQRMSPGRPLLFLVSDFGLMGRFDPEFERIWPALRESRSRHGVVSVLVHDPDELELPDVGRVSLTGRRPGEQTVIDTSRSSVRRAYQLEMERRVHRITHRMREAGVDMVQLAVERAYQSDLLSFFDRCEPREAS